MAIEQLASRRVRQHEQALEQAIARAVNHRSRVRRMFKVIPVGAGTGFDLTNEDPFMTGSISIHPRTLRTTSVVAARTGSSIDLDDLLTRGSEFVNGVLVDEDRYLLRKLAHGSTTSSPKGSSTWDAVLNAIVDGPEKTVVDGEWTFAEPQTLLAVPSERPTVAEISTLLKRNVTVVNATDGAGSGLSCWAGFLVPSNSGLVALRVETDWRMMWDMAEESGQIDLLMEARWSESIRSEIVVRFAR